MTLTPMPSGLLPAVKSAMPPSDPKDWAKRIIERSQSGEKVNPTTLTMAKDALHMTSKTGAV